MQTHGHTGPGAEPFILWGCLVARRSVLRLPVVVGALVGVGQGVVRNADLLEFLLRLGWDAMG